MALQGSSIERGTMSDDREARYQQIMRRLAERRAEQAIAPAREKQGDLANVLDGLDALGKLEKLRASRALRQRTYGPKSVSGLSPAPWVAAIIWRLGSGYFGYRTLQLTGIWTVQDQPGPPLVLAGTKWLSYNAPTYEAEAFMKLIRRSFDLYYSGDASPPPAQQRFYATRYTASRRLEIRDELKAALAQWAAST